MDKVWGQLLSVDLGKCDVKLLRDRRKLAEFSERLCEVIDMVPVGKPLIKKFGKGSLNGYSLMQFIETSSITVHLDEFGYRAFIDIFSCKRFDVKKAVEFCKNFYRAKSVRYKNLFRK